MKSPEELQRMQELKFQGFMERLLQACHTEEERLLIRQSEDELWVKYSSSLAFDVLRKIMSRMHLRQVLPPPPPGD